MKIALAQLDVQAGRPRKNVERMVEMIREAKLEDADLIAFPEMAVGGYLVGDKWTDDSWCRNLMEYNEVLREASEDIVVVYGNVFTPSTNLKGYDGRLARFNSVYVMENGVHLGNFHKTLLPTYRIFDDRRYFLSSSDFEEYNLDMPIELSNGVKIGCEVCEDMWWEDYGNNVTEKLIDRGADIIINVSSSPWTYGKNRARDNRIKHMKNMLGDKFVYFYYVNACGVQNNGKNIVTLDGDSRAYGPDGIKIGHKHLHPYEEGILYFDRADFLYNEETTDFEQPKIRQKMDAIIRAYRGIDEMLEWEPNYVFGLSGGIDSSVAATLAVMALGKERVIGFNMPSQYNSEATKSAATKLAMKLGIKCKTIPITQMANINTAMLMLSEKEITDLHEENIQAKIRGTSLLSNLAAMYNGVMTNNGNKLEIALGYATLYGDVNGVFAPLGDLTKAEVFEMARYINKFFGDIIPSELIPDENFDFGNGIKPSAELKDEQVDPMKFGYHDRMLEMMMDYKKHSPEDFMNWYINGELCEKMGIPVQLFNKYHLHDPHVFMDDLEWFVDKIQKSVFKRVQAPPVVMLSKTAFGYDLRESQFYPEHTLEYDRLKSIIIGEEK